MTVALVHQEVRMKSCLPSCQTKGLLLVSFIISVGIFQYLLETADNLAGLPYKLHDFGFRGSTSVEVSVL